MGILVAATSSQITYSDVEDSFMTWVEKSYKA